MAWLPDGEKTLKISLFVLAQLTNVTHTHTQRQTDTACRHIPRLCIASRSKNQTCCRHMSFSAGKKMHFQSCKSGCGIHKSGHNDPSRIALARTRMHCSDTNSTSCSNSWANLPLWACWLSQFCQPSTSLFILIDDWKADQLLAGHSWLLFG